MKKYRKLMQEKNNPTLYKFKAMTDILLLRFQRFSFMYKLHYE